MIDSAPDPISIFLRHYVGERIYNRLSAGHKRHMRAHAREALRAYENARTVRPKWKLTDHHPDDENRRQRKERDEK